MRTSLLSLALLISTAPAVLAQKPRQVDVSRPKLVVGVVIDQMRWDYLYRFYDRYDKNGGFRRFLNKGFTCDNTQVPYTPTYTACGHSCVYTGSVPAIHGIAGNSWWDNSTQKEVYCAEDNTVETVGATDDAGKMSPRNMLTTSVCDELRLATNFRSKVVGVAIKDRGSILPAGHSANAAFWYDSKNGNWITSTYYMPQLPDWVNNFNQQKRTDYYYGQNWNTLYPIDSYVQSTPDEEPYESRPLGSDQKGFPYDLTRFAGKNYGAISSTPWGNTITREMAQAAVTGEQLGADDITDFLAVSFSSPDYIGHAFGPNSVEEEDNYLRLDKELGEFFRFLDDKVGKNNYVIFLTADHAVAHVPGFNEEHKLPGRILNVGGWRDEMKQEMNARFGTDKLIVSMENMQLSLNHALIQSMNLDIEAVKKWIVEFVSKQDGVARVIPMDQLMTVPLNSRLRELFVNGYYPPRCGDLQIILQPGWFSGGKTGTTHGSPYLYDTHIPLLWYGWHIKKGKTNRETYMTDIAATVAGLLNIQMPSGCIGHVIEEVME